MRKYLFYRSRCILQFFFDFLVCILSNSLNLGAYISNSFFLFVFPFTLLPNSLNTLLKSFVYSLKKLDAWYIYQISYFRFLTVFSNLNLSLFILFFLNLTDKFYLRVIFIFHIVFINICFLIYCLGLNT